MSDEQLGNQTRVDYLKPSIIMLALVGCNNAHQTCLLQRVLLGLLVIMYLVQ
ncbi:hypothetical protein X777_06750 [Ooceraea biroi]|uniref:Uncharacterized protein n=1 Tax=Ooceraea biroi TaxID=2015173 RepID=A0A026X3V1_OOCBI|nr:hypothetical protein X777_06750 [Ooceraea biroi]